MGKNLWAVVIIVLVLGLGGYLAYRSYSSTQPTQPSPTPTVETPTSTPTTPESSPSADESMSQNVVSITASGFEPKTITVKAGTAVTWTNKDDKTHNVSSNPHPTHTIYPTMNLGNIVSLKSGSITFPTKGTYGYHDHLFPNLTGTVVVQ